MRNFIYFSSKARTSGNFPDNDLMKAGRMDIVCNVIIQALFLSNDMRKDVHLHLIFTGMPNPPMHLEFVSDKLDKETISKKDVAGLIKRMLYKCPANGKNEVFPGCFIEKKSLQKLIKELEVEGKEIFVLDKKGVSIRELGDSQFDNCVFLIGDHDGLPRKEIKGLNKISIGKKTYFASQTIVIINNEMDLRGE
jgi:tRNA (pseudouridine54-N1)-methyltransferase